jgi:hypothetical protein
MFNSTITTSNGRPASRRRLRECFTRIRIVGVSALAFVVLAAGLARAQTKAPPATGKRSAGATADVSVSRFVVDGRQELRKLREHLAELAAPLMVALGSADRPEGDVASEAIAVDSAKVRYQAAQLRREIAEVALKEYQQGIYRQQKAAVDTEITLTEAELESAQRRAPLAEERFDKIKRVATGSAADLSTKWKFELAIVSAELSRKKAELAVEQAQSKLMVLENYEKTKHIRELNSNIDKARSDELAKQAAWELEQSKLTRRQRRLKGGVPLSDDQKRMLAMLGAVIPVEERLGVKLDQIKADGEPGDAVRNEVRDLASELRAIVDNAQSDLVSAALSRLKPKIDRRPPASSAVVLGDALARTHSRLVGSQSDSPAGVPKSLAVADSGSPVALKAAPEPARFMIEARGTLADLQSQILGIAATALGPADAASKAKDNAINQRITVESAKANYGNATLTREVAEIAILEYEQGIFKQDDATLQGELKLAESGLDRAMDSIEYLKGRLAEIKKASKNSAQDLALQFTYEDSLADAELRVPRAKLALETAHTQLDLLRKFARPKRVKELKSVVENARADELAKQALLELEKSKLAKLEAADKGPARQTAEDRVLALLDRAISIAEELKNKLDLASKAHEPSEAVRKEIGGLMAQLDALVEQAQEEATAAKWAKLKPMLHEAALRNAGASVK